MQTQTTLTVSNPAGERVFDVEVVARRGGLILHRTVESLDEEDRWTITHEPSGFALATDMAQDVARELLDSLAQLGGWEQVQSRDVPAQLAVSALEHLLNAGVTPGVLGRISPTGTGAQEDKGCLFDPALLMTETHERLTDLADFARRLAREVIRRPATPAELFQDGVALGVWDEHGDILDIYYTQRDWTPRLVRNWILRHRAQWEKRASVAAMLTHAKKRWPDGDWDELGVCDEDLLATGSTKP